jgi:hypothetical protein
VAFLPKPFAGVELEQRAQELAEISHVRVTPKQTKALGVRSTAV